MEVMAYTYCKNRVPGGMLGSHQCGNRMQLGEKLCSECKSQPKK